MKWIKKMSTMFLPKIFGNIVDTKNITDKISNTYSARIIEELTDVKVPTKTSELTNDSGFLTGLKFSSLVPVNHTILSPVNINPSNSKSGTVNLTKAGYYPIGISGWESTETTFHISAASLGKASIYYYAYNPHPNTVTCKLNVRILWAK